jgi:hypothetical protein
LCSVPPQWTDEMAPEPDVVVGQGRAVARIADLLELFDIVRRLLEQQRGPLARKGKDAACVKRKTPQRVSDAESDAPMYAVHRRVVRHRKLDRANRKLDRATVSGVVVVTNRTSEAECESETLAKTRKQRRSSRTAR